MAFFDPLAAIGSTISNLASGVLTNVETALTNVEQNFQKVVFNPVVGAVESGLQGIENGLSGVLNNVSSAAGAAIDNIGNGLADLGSGLATTFNNVVSGVATGFTTLSGGIYKDINSLLGGLGGLADTLQRSLTEALNAVGSDIGAAFKSVLDGVAGVFDPLLTNIEGFLQSIPGGVEAAASTVAEVIKNIPDGIKDVVKVWEHMLDPNYKTGLAAKAEVGLINGLGKFLGTIVAPILNDILAAAGFQPGTISPDSYRKIIEAAAAESALGALEELSPSTAYIISNLIKSVTEPLLSGVFRELDYAGNQDKPNRLLPITTAVSLFFRGELTDDELKSDLIKEGYSNEAVSKIVKASTTLQGISGLVDARYRGLITSDEEYFKRANEIAVPKREAQEALEQFKEVFNPGTSIEFWRRGILPKGFKDHFDDLRIGGWSEERIDALKSVSYQLPNIFQVQDFVVRDVDNPETVKKFDLDFGINEDYFKQAAALGWDRKTAQRIYRYYWEYPPFFQVKGMYESGQIPEQDFRDILKFLRFTPYWVDRLTTSLAPKLTQGDVKDMYKYQVIGAAQIIPELKKIGVADELAIQLSELWQASVKLATPLDSTSAQQQAAKIKGDTLSLVLTAYKDKIINKQQATDELKKIGYTDDIIGLELAITDYNIHNDYVKQQVGYIKDLYKARAIDLTAATTQLQALNVTNDQLNQYLLEIEQTTSSKTAVPTKAEFDAWYKKGIISLSQLAAGLTMLGYNEAWLPYYLSQAGASADDINSLGFTTPAALEGF